MSTVLLAGSALCGTALLAAFCWRKPARCLAVVLASILLIPYWTGLALGVQIPAVVLATGLALILVGVTLPGQLARVDFVLSGLVLAVLLGTILGVTETYDSAVTIGQWAVPYILGRLIGQRAREDDISKRLIVFVTLLAGLAVVEFVLDWHPFTNLATGTNSYITWSQIQERAGLPRSEWTLGHSIALGNTLAIAIPFVILSRIRFPAKAALLAVLMAGVVVTFSRNAIVAAGFAFIVTLALLRKEIPQRQFTALVGAGSLVLTSVFYALTTIAGAAGPETADSSASRFVQLKLSNEVEILGKSASAVVLPDGSLGFVSGLYERGFTSTVDNSILLLALRTGWIPAAFLVLLFVFLLADQIRAGARNPAAIAVIGQIPTILTTAMITQYAVVIWLVIGLSVSATRIRSETDRSRRPLMTKHEIRASSDVADRDTTSLASNRPAKARPR